MIKCDFGDQCPGHASPNDRPCSYDPSGYAHSEPVESKPGLSKPYAELRLAAQELLQDMVSTLVAAVARAEKEELRGDAHLAASKQLSQRIEIANRMRPVVEAAREALSIYWEAFTPADLIPIRDALRALDASPAAEPHPALQSDSPYAEPLPFNLDAERTIAASSQCEEDPTIGILQAQLEAAEKRYADLEQQNQVLDDGFRAAVSRADETAKLLHAMRNNGDDRLRAKCSRQRRELRAKNVQVRAHRGDTLALRNCLIDAEARADRACREEGFLNVSLASHRGRISQLETELAVLNEPPPTEAPQASRCTCWNHDHSHYAPAQCPEHGSRKTSRCTCVGPVHGDWTHSQDCPEHGR